MAGVDYPALEPENDLERLWGSLLSENAGLIRRAWGELNDDEARAVMKQLRAMADDAERAEVQRRAAEFAMQAIRDAF